MSSQTIRVTPEGREGIWLADRASLKAFIAAQDFAMIHNMIPGGPFMLGADHEVESVQADIDNAERVAIMTGESFRNNLNHALALILPSQNGLPETLSIYDIGEITEDDLSVGETSNAG